MLREISKERADVSSPSTREELANRREPYWSLIAYGRHLGFQKRVGQQPRWIARFRTGAGKYRQAAMGSVGPECETGLTHAEALVAAQEWFRRPENSSIASEAVPAGLRDDLIICPIGANFTVGHAFKDYIEWKRVVASRTHFFTNLSLINYHIIPRLSDVSLEQFTGLHLRDFAKDVLETPPKRGKRRLGPRRPIGTLDVEGLRKRKKTLNTLIGLLRMAFRMAWENGRIESDRAWRCLHRVPNVDLPRMQFLTRAECGQLLDHCRPDLRQLVLGALYTGCRATELQRMRVGDVGREGYGVYVAPSKSYRPRFVFLSDEAMYFFLDLCGGRSPDDFLFVRGDGGRWRDYQKPLFRQAVRNAGLPSGFVFHGLRHTYASQLVQAGTPLSVIADQLGHASTSTVSRTYGHLAPQVREAEIRHRFTTISEDLASRAASDRDRLDNLRATLRGTDWRAYAQMPASGHWPRANFFRGDAELVRLFAPDSSERERS